MYLLTLITLLLHTAAPSVSNTTMIPSENVVNSSEVTTLQSSDTVKGMGRASSDLTIHCNQTENTSLCRDKQTSKDKATLQELITESMSKRIKYIVMYINLFLCGVGLATNSLNIAVFLSKTGTSTNCFLISISALDILCVATLLVGNVYSVAHGTEVEKTWFYNCYTILSVSLYLNPVLQRSLYLLVLHVSIERFLIVAFPLKAKEFILTRFPKTIICSTLLVVALFHIFSPLRYMLESVVRNNETIYTITRSHLFQKHPAVLNAASTSSKIIFVYSVLLSALFVNILLVSVLMRHSRYRRQMTVSTAIEKAARQERKTTVTVMTSSVVFLILAIPLNTASILFNALPHLLGRSGPYHHLYSVVVDLATALVILSYSADFMTYMILSGHFRKTCFHIFHIGQRDSECKQTRVTISRT